MVYQRHASLLIARHGANEYKKNKKMLKYIRKATMLFFLAITALAVSCSKDNNSNNSITDDGAVYFVKYIAKFTATGGGGVLNTQVTYTTSNGTKTETITRGSEFSAIAGPFEKGRTVSISSNLPAGSYSEYSRIEVQKNEDPFVVKAVSSNSMNCSYTIDF